MSYSKIDDQELYDGYFRMVKKRDLEDRPVKVIQTMVDNGVLDDATLKCFAIDRTYVPYTISDLCPMCFKKPEGRRKKYCSDKCRDQFLRVFYPWDTWFKYKKKRCAVCLKRAPLDCHHIIPRKLLVENSDKIDWRLHYTTHNVVYLCKDCHANTFKDQYTQFINFNINFETICNDLSYISNVWDGYVKKKHQLGYSDKHVDDERLKEISKSEKKLDQFINHKPKMDNHILNSDSLRLIKIPKPESKLENFIK